VRKQIYIEPNHRAILKRLSRERGVTEAESIRQASGEHTGAPRRSPHLAAGGSV